MISPFLELGLGINRRRIQLGIRCCHRIGAELKTRVAILFFVTMVSVFVASAVITFYISYMVSPFLELSLGIIQRIFQLGIRWCYRIGADLETRVGIRFFVTMVSVFLDSGAVTFYISYVISPFLEHVIGINRRGFQLGIRWCHGIGAELKTRVAILFFVTMVSVLSLYVAVTFYISYMISPFLKHVLGINRRRIQLGIRCCHRIGAELKTRVAILFFVTMVSVFVASAVITFYISYMVSPFLELSLGIIQRIFQLGIRWCYRIGADLETRVGIRFFVTMVSVFFGSGAVTFYISYMISPFLELSLGIIRRGFT